MKAEISHAGVLCIIPENETEAYALACWRDHSKVVVMADDLARMQRVGETHWRDTALKVGTNWPPRLGERT